MISFLNDLAAFRSFESIDFKAVEIHTRRICSFTDEQYGSVYEYLINYQKFNYLIITKEAELVTGYSLSDLYAQGQGLVLGAMYGSDSWQMTKYGYSKVLSYIAELPVQDKPYALFQLNYRIRSKSGVVQNCTDRLFFTKFDARGIPLLCAGAVFNNGIADHFGFVPSIKIQLADKDGSYTDIFEQTF